MRYKSLQYINHQNTMIKAVRFDGSSVIVEPENVDMWDIFTHGHFGDVAAYVAPPPAPVVQRSNPICDIFRVGMVAAQAVADGATDLTDEEILSILKASK